ncbi:hypothetical protein GCM10023224_44760 [Streptomonospora halophila]|uniref:DUF4244 domain-containing protein n=1 Tax=Streptomonospora halophila TaxID=427369 RepID=A0ABP9GYV4_9ACTN
METARAVPIVPPVLTGLALSGVRAVRAVARGLASATAALLRSSRAVPGVRPLASVRGDRGMSTAEYALGTVTACAFAAVLFAILTSDEVRTTVTRIVTDALQIDG